MGLAIGYQNQQYKDYSGTETMDAGTIGSQMGYTFGSKSNRIIPFVSIGSRYTNSRIGRYSSVGIGAFGGLGTIININEHVGLTTEFDFAALVSKGKFYSSLTHENIASFNFGFVVIL